MKQVLFPAPLKPAQRKVESATSIFVSNCFEYDDVANDQRKDHALRNEILENKDVSGPVKELRDGYFTSLFRHYVPADTVEEQWDLEGLEKELKEQWNLDVPLKATLEKSESSDDKELLDMLLAATNKVYDEKVALVGHEAFAQFERNVLLQFLDQRWRGTSASSICSVRASISAAMLRNSRNRNTSAKL